MLKKLTATKLILAMVLSFGMLAFAATPADGACTCFGTELTCWIKNGDGTWGWIAAPNHPKCLPK